jgi:hypothetical protein
MITFIIAARLLTLLCVGVSQDTERVLDEACIIAHVYGLSDPNAVNPSRVTQIERRVGGYRNLA